MTNILIAEDHAIVRDGLKSLLESDENIRIVAQAENGREAVEILTKGSEVDVVLTDINIPEMNGIELTKEIKKKRPDVKVVVLSMHNNENYVYEAFRAGASAYLMKSASATELKFALNQVQSGGKYICSSLVIDKIFADMERKRTSSIATDFELTSRETEVLELLAQGLTNQEMSDKLFLSKRTVEGHRQALLNKFNVRNTAELICTTMRSGILS